MNLQAKFSFNDYEIQSWLTFTTDSRSCPLSRFLAIYCPWTSYFIARITFNISGSMHLIPSTCDNAICNYWNVETSSDWRTSPSCTPKTTFVTTNISIPFQLVPLITSQYPLRTNGTFSVTEHSELNNWKWSTWAWKMFSCKSIKLNWNSSYLVGMCQEKTNYHWPYKLSLVNPWFEN